VHLATALTPYVNRLRFTFFLVFCLFHHLYYQVHFAACLTSSCCYPQPGSRSQELRYSEYHLPHIVPHLQAAVALGCPKRHLLLPHPKEWHPNSRGSQAANQHQKWYQLQHLSPASSLHPASLQRLIGAHSDVFLSLSNDQELLVAGAKKHVASEHCTSVS